jgi:hypothetical protein
VFHQTNRIRGKVGENRTLSFLLQPEIMKCVKKLEVFTQNEMEWKQKIGYPQNMI